MKSQASLIRWFAFVPCFLGLFVALSLWGAESLASGPFVERFDPDNAQLNSASEGFFYRDSLAPAPVRKNWDSVFLFMNDNGERIAFGTAFVVDRQVTKASAKLFLLTNWHVIRTWCIAEGGACPFGHIAQNVRIAIGEHGGTLEGFTGLTTRKIKVVRASLDPDLVLVSAEFPANAHLPPALSMVDSCNIPLRRTMYAVGFSNTASRNNANSIFSPSPLVVTKRWSKGIFTGPVDVVWKETDHTGQKVVGTTADILSGGSGGPLFDEDGKVLAVVIASSSLEDNGYAYTGEDARMSPQAAAVPCEQVATFLKEARTHERRP